MSRVVGAFGLAAMLAVSSPPLAAHSLLLESSPAAGATVAAPPQVSLRFNTRLEKGLSRLRVVDAAGVGRALSIAAAESPLDRLTAALPALDPGVYRVEWQVLSSDGHVVRGAFAFTVAP